MVDATALKRDSNKTIYIRMIPYGVERQRGRVST